MTTLAGRVPGNPGAWGWRQHPGGFPVPAGDRVGWLDGDDLYLEPHKTYQVVQKLAKDGGESISIGASALHKRLADRKLLVSTDRARERLTVRKQIDGARRPVLTGLGLSCTRNRPNRPIRPRSWCGRWRASSAAPTSNASSVRQAEHVVADGRGTRMNPTNNIDVEEHFLGQDRPLHPRGAPEVLRGCGGRGVHTGHQNIGPCARRSSAVM